MTTGMPAETTEATPDACAPVTTLDYLAVEPVWAFRAAPGLDSIGRRRRRASARSALEAASRHRALPSLFGRLTRVGNPAEGVTDAAVDELVRLCERCGHDGGYVTFATAGLKDARVYDGVGFTTRHVKLRGDDTRFARVVGAAVRVHYDERRHAFLCGSNEVDHLQMCRDKAVPTSGHSMHFLGDPISLQHAALVGVKRPGEVERVIATHVSGLRDLTRGDDSSGVATDLWTYDCLRGTDDGLRLAISEHGWRAGVAMIHAMARNAWPSIVASEASIALCRAIDAPVTLFERLAEDDHESRENYILALEALADTREGRAVGVPAEPSHDAAHVGFDDERRDVGAAVESFLDRLELVASTHHGGEDYALHRDGGSWYLSLSGGHEHVVVCWSAEPQIPRDATMH